MYGEISPKPVYADQFYTLFYT